MRSESPAMVFANISVQFGGVRALENISIEVAPRSIHAIIGPNGAGKTTLFNTISGLVSLSSGQICMGEIRLDTLKPHEIANVGIGRTFQNLAIFGDLSVEENLLLGRHVRSSAGWLSSGLGLRSVRVEHRKNLKKVREIGAFVGISELLPHRASSLSYGDKKRLEFARALCTDPKVLLLDEPVAGMNANETQVMIDLIRTVRDEFQIAMVLVEHDMNVVMGLADKITVLDFGQVIAQGTAEEIVDDPKVLEAYLGQLDDQQDEGSHPHE